MRSTPIDVENADRDLTSQVTILTHTPSTLEARLCQVYVALGDGTKNLDGTGGDFELTITVGGQTVQPDPQVMTFSTAVRSSYWSTQFVVPANDQVVVKVKSPNAADTDVDVICKLYDVGQTDEPKQVELPFPCISRGTLVPVNETGEEGTNYAIGVASGVRTWLKRGHKDRIRQPGTVKAIRIYIQQTDDMTAVRFRIFRYNGATYDEVGASEIFADTDFVEESWNTMTLANPITGVEVGDMVAVVLTVDDNTVPEFWGDYELDADDYSMRWQNADVTGAAQTFSGGELAGYSIRIECQMEAPVLVWLGDSYWGGTTDTDPGGVYCRAFMNSLPAGKVWTDVTPEADVGGYFAALDGRNLPYQTHSIGGSAAAEWATAGSDYITTWGVNYYPRAAIVNLGYADAVAETAVATYMVAMKSIIQTLLANQIVPIIVTVFQYPAGSAAQKLLIRQYNAALKDYCRDLGLPCVDAWSLLASAADPDTRNTTLFGSDTHPWTAAYKAIASAIYAHRPGAYNVLPAGQDGDTGETLSDQIDFVALADKLLGYVQLLARKDAAIATDRATELSEINANEGTGPGAYANTTDSGEAIRDTAPMGTAMRGTDSAFLAASAPANFSALGINASGHVSRVTLVDTTTVNSDMRGTDSAFLAASAPANFSALGINASGHVSRVTLVDTCTANSDMRGTDSAFLAASAPANFAALGINASGHISRVTLVDTTTTNSDMRGTDSAALAATALSNAVWTDAKAGYLDVAVSTRSAPGTAQTITANQSVNVNQWSGGTVPTFPTNFAALGINASGHISRVTLVDTCTTNTDMRGTNNAFLAASAPANFSALGINASGHVSRVTLVDTTTTNSDMPTFPANFAALGINASGHVSRVTLVDTTTVNTDMRGTNNAALAATALSNLVWTDAKAGYLTGAVALEATLTAIKGAGWSTETLVAIDALIDALPPPIGEGAYTGVLTVDDGDGNGLQGVIVNARRGGALIASRTTDANGQITDWVFDANTYALAIRLSGYQPKTDTLTVTGNGWAKSTSLTALSITPPDSPDLCTVQFRVMLGDTPVQGAVCKGRLLGINEAADGTVLSNEEVSDTTDAEGIAELELVQKGSIVKGTGIYTLWVEINGKPVSNIQATIPNQSTFLYEDLL